MVELKTPIPFIKTIDSFAGGENNNLDPTNIGDNQLVSTKDFKLDEGGNLLMRGGCTAITNYSGSEVGKWIGKWTKNDTSNLVLVAAEDKLYRKNGISFTEVIPGLTTASLNASESFVNTSDTNFLYFVSSIDGVYRVLDDYTYAAAGCVAPTVKPTTANNGAGGLTGNYYWSYTYLYEHGESDESPPSDVLLTATNKVLVTFGAIPAAALGVFIYRTLTGALIRKQLIYVSVGTSYDDNLSDGVLGAIAPTDNGLPRKSVDILMYNNYMFYIDYLKRDRMYYSTLQYPDIVGVNDYDNPIRDVSNRAMKLSYTSNPSFLVLFYQKSIVAYNGTSPFITDDDPMVMFTVSENLGCPSPNSVTRTAGDIIFYGDDNRVHMIRKISLASTETVQEVSISANIDGFLQSRVGLGINKTMIPYFSGWFLDGKYFLQVSTGSNAYLDTLLEMDFKLPGMPWTHHELIASTFGLNIVDNDIEVSVLLSNTTPNLYQFNSGLTDAGALITPELETKHWDFDHVFNRKVVRNIKLMGEASPEYAFSVRVWFEKGSELTSNVFYCSGTASSGATATTTQWTASATWGQGNWTANVSWSNVITNFMEDLPVMSDGEIMWFEIYDVNSVYRLKFKKFEIRGFVMRSRP